MFFYRRLSLSPLVQSRTDQHKMAVAMIRAASCDMNRPTCSGGSSHVMSRTEVGCLGGLLHPGLCRVVAAAAPSMINNTTISATVFNKIVHETDIKAPP